MKVNDIGSRQTAYYDYYVIMICFSIAQIYIWIWSNVLYIKYYAYLITYLA